jgi:RNA polymerase sigma-70 factor (ECF subfamily)
MSEDSAFRDLIRRARAGDQRAAEELLRGYEPALRLVVRRRLTDPSLRRLLDSTDVCQSVLGTFFVRLVLGQFEVDSPDQLMKLLAAMARNKVCNLWDQQRAACRDQRRNHGDGEVVEQLPDPASSPSQAVATQELLREVRGHLSEEEWRLVDLRYYQNCSWEAIAAQVGGQVDAVRMRLQRALARVKNDLGLAD